MGVPQETKKEVSQETKKEVSQETKKEVAKETVPIFHKKETVVLTEKDKTSKSISSKSFPRLGKAVIAPPPGYNPNRIKRPSTSTTSTSSKVESSTSEAGDKEDRWKKKEKGRF